jgi:2-dehydropantoate 2-reductase
MLRPLSRQFSASVSRRVAAEKATPFLGPPDADAPIHVLGVGNLGKYVAHSLAKSSPKPVTLIFHRKRSEREWLAQGCAITCIADGIADRRSGFEIESLPAMQNAPEPIKHLIVATKAHVTLEALRPLKEKLNADSVILFLQNGMGRPCSSHTLKPF